jgi:hypothetical protein
MAGSFDAVVTCFFIDTAHNILEYLEVIHRCAAAQGGAAAAFARSAATGFAVLVEFWLEHLAIHKEGLHLRMISPFLSMSDP